MPALTCFAAPVISPRASAAAGEIPLLMPGKSSVRNSFGNFESEHELLSPAWSVERSASLYNIHGWGAPYFTVNAHGHISIRPFGDKTQDHQEIDLMEVVGRISDTRSTSGLGLQLPAIIRFPHVLKNRLECLQSAFDVAIESQGYESHYQGVYPVKCNQDRFIVEDIVEFGTSFHFGLEAGSKPELLLAMSCLAKGSPNAFLICNGYKDAEYISLALIAKKMNLNTMIVLEQEEELDLVIKISKNLGISPVLGLRAKLRTNHTGHFGSTSGEKGKFGLNSIQIINVVKKLKKSGMLDCLQLLHFHIGSQIPSTDLLCHGVQEAAQIYCDLVHFGANMGIIDIGGGLGIDYDGTKSTHSDISVGYGLNEYASAVVKTIRNVCNRKFVKHPVISSESGRALVSHHSVLIFEATTGTNTKKSPMDLSHAYKSLIGESISNYRNLISAALRGEYETCLLYADQLKSHCVHQFKEGSIGLEQLAAVDNLYDMVSKSVANSSDSIRKYNVNLSLFTSIPDFWAIGQLFPITPIHRLNQRPTVNGVLVDLTCDSDGKVDRFIGGKKSLPLHETESGSGYYLGMFLGGAYQEALGGSHNLFGSPNVVRVTSCDGPTNFTVNQVSMGKTCADVLGHMQHEPESMLATLTRQAESCGLDKQAMATYLQRQFNSSPYLVSNAGR